MKKTTISFRMVVGVAEGYFHNISGVAAPELANKIAALWQQLAKAEFEEFGEYISAAVSPAAVVYNTDWGCPVGGESVIKIEGTCNPQFCNRELYKPAVMRLAEALKKELQQSTLSAEFWESELVYLT